MNTLPSIKMTFGEAIKKYDLGWFPTYTVDDYSDRTVCVFEQDVHFENLELDKLFFADGIEGVIFCKDVTVDGYFLQEEREYGPLVVALGNVAAKNIFVSGSSAYFRGNVTAQQTLVCGVYNHGETTIDGEISADIVFSFDHMFNFEESNLKKGVLVDTSFLRGDKKITDIVQEKYCVDDEVPYLDDEAVLSAVRAGDCGVLK